jgi:serine/threonine-protein kinase
VKTLSTAWFPGATIGRYQLITPLASGGMAEIWLARQPGLRGFEKVVVIKRMVGALEEDPEHVEMFVTEARLAAGLTHPHVVQIYELGQEQGSFYIVMEFIDGESWSSVWKEGLRKNKPMAGPLAAQLVAWTAEGLHYAHTRTGQNGEPQVIIHRDVSPQNLIVTYDGSVKLVDFGIAKVATEATVSGKLKGKLAYMSPEQGRTEPLDPRSDVFSLGVVLFEMVTRTRLFPRLEDLEILRLIISGGPMPRAQERRADVPDALDRIIAKALAQRREHRFGSARELQDALEDWLLRTGRRTTAADVADYMRGLFSERLEQRRSLIESAKRGDLSIFTASKMPPPTPEPVDAPAVRSLDGGFSLRFGLGGRGWAARLKVLGLAVAAVVAAVVLAVIAAGGTNAPDEKAPPAAAPAPAHSTLVIESRPSGARLVVDGVARGTTPVVLDDVEPGEHHVWLSADGFVSEKRAVAIGAVAERISLIVALERETQTAEEPRKVERAPAPPPRPTGRLNLATTPWTTVYLGARKLGDTPLVSISLPAGRHVLTLVNSEMNLNSSVEVDIVANETTVKRLALQ